MAETKTCCSEREDEGELWSHLDWRRLSPAPRRSLLQSCSESLLRGLRLYRPPNRPKISHESTRSCLLLPRVKHPKDKRKLCST